MKLLHRCLAIGAVAAVLSSCSQEAPFGTSGGEGRIVLNLSALNDVKSAIPQVRAEGEDIANIPIVTPPVEEFQIRLTKVESGEQTTFSTVKDFVDKADFPVGKYEIEAFYGTENSQGFVEGKDEGYENAFYYGVTTDITVVENTTTDVELHASLANAIVDIEYSDAFKMYFSKWSTTLQTGGNSPLVLGMNGGRSYVIPGDMSITIDAWQQNGIETQLTPTSFPVEAQHQYQMRYNVFNNEVGDAMLEISFDKNLEVDPVIVDLSKVLGNVPAPTISTIGFEPDEGFQTLEGTSFDGEVKFNVVARGAIKNAFLRIDSETFQPSFLEDGMIDLCAADDVKKGEMQEQGINAIGFFGKNRGEMAQLDLTNLCKALPSGRHNLSLQVVDSISQSCDPIGLTISTVPVDILITPGTSDFKDGKAEFTISYNGLEPTVDGPFTFETKEGFNQKPCRVTNVTRVPNTRASSEFPSYDYVFEIEAPIVDKDAFPLYVYFNGGIREELTTEIPYTYCDYEVDLDATATQLQIRLEKGNFTQSQYERLFNKLHVTVDNKRYAQKDVKRDITTGIITIPGITSGSDLRVKTTLVSNENTQDFTTDQQIQSEVAQQVPNGDFEDLVETINTTIQQGGKWTITNTPTASKHTTTLSMVIKEPTGWSTSNSITCDLNASNLNSWYVIPSVYNTTLSWISHQPDAKVMGIGQSAYNSTANEYQNLIAPSGVNAMVIRNVAWDINGEDIPDTKQTGDGEHSNYFGNNQPKIANRSAGRLYLGSESKEGVPFASRPTALNGKFKYVRDANDPDEMGVITVQLMSGSEVIGSGEIELNAGDNYADFKIPIQYVSDIFGKKATDLKINITSSNRTQDIKTTNYCNKDECCSRGAALYVDALSFDY